MQILGKRSKALIIAVAILMLTALGLSFALWDTSSVKAVSGESSKYANAKVGDIVTFGRYYQTANSADMTPIEWIVVDKDERTGQLTLMSKYILAYGSYFGNNYYSNNGVTTSYIDAEGNIINMTDYVAGVAHNQAWSQSTARAFLNNLERFDLGGDIFNASEGLSKTRTNSIIHTVNDSKGNSLKLGELLPSIGFSNSRYWTGLSYANETVKNIVDSSPEFMTRRDKEENNEVYYQRVKLTKPEERLARNGFLDEAFSADEKQMITPRNIPGQISHRWPNTSHFLNQAEYVPGTTDKVWLPSAEELNVKEGVDWVSNPEDSWTNPSELASSEPFEYFKNYKAYGFSKLANAIKTTHTEFAAQNNGLGNYSIPGWVPNEQIGDNTSNHYWTRSASSQWYYHVRVVYSTGVFNQYPTFRAYHGVRPCILLQY